MFKSIISRSALCILAMAMIACKKTSDSPTPATAATSYSNLQAGTVSFPPGGPPVVTGNYTLFSFKNNAIVANVDSNTTKWDLGFFGTTIITNGGTSGPGTAGVVMQSSTTFENVLTAPTSGYASDNGATKAIATGSGNGWYNYNGITQIISPIPGRVFIIKTADGKYVKLEILSYYKDAPSAPTNTSLFPYYTFRFVYQADGSTNLK
jgi:hypothetical protein